MAELQIKQILNIDDVNSFNTLLPPQNFLRYGSSRQNTPSTAAYLLHSIKKNKTYKVLLKQERQIQKMYF